jgi:DNA-binding NarL/FixJ family response regulator
VVYGLALAEIGEPADGIAVATDRAGGPTLPRVPAAWRGFFLDRLIPAWLALGRHDDACAAAAEAETVATDTGLRSAGSSALRARARVELDAGEATAAAEHAAAAGDISQASGARIAAGTSRVLAGRALAAAGARDAAVAVLETAAQELDACGAIRFRDEAERELGKLGRRRSRRSRPGIHLNRGDGVESLTERELEVARLIVDRRTNAQIAAELFVSPKTVETHVRHLFEKLGVSSRVEVARVVDRAEPRR